MTVPMVAMFQSPIYGSRTREFQLLEFRVILVSIPYLRVTHEQLPYTMRTLKRVSIPYLRVTHGRSVKHLPVCQAVSIPYLRVTHKCPAVAAGFLFRFQSPIYGSRTRDIHSQAKQYYCFNPLSTGHAPGQAPLNPDVMVQFQSPIYGSRT